MAGDRIVLNPSAEEKLRNAGFSTCAAFLDLPGGEAVAKSRTTSTVRAQGEGLGAFYLKRYRFPTLADRVRGLFRGTLFGRCKAEREYENLLRLTGNGLAAPEPIAWGARRAGLLLGEAFLAASAIPDAERADAFLARTPPLPRRERTTAIRAAAAGIAALHKAGYTDGSMALRNLLVARDGTGFKVFKVDCAKGRWRIPPGFPVVEDLARLDAGAMRLASVRDRLRFLKTYLGGELGDRARHWIEVIARVRTRYEADERVRLSEPGAPLHK